MSLWLAAGLMKLVLQAGVEALPSHNVRTAVKTAFANSETRLHTAD